MALPQGSGLESRGHRVTVGKTILSIGKVSTTDFIGFSYQPASVNFIFSRCQTKFKPAMKSQIWPNSKSYWRDQANLFVVKIHFGPIDERVVH